MKNILCVCIAVALTAPAWAAASTCQSRIDKNLNKSTAEKVEKCLTDEPEVQDEGPVTEVLVYDTYTVQYPKAPKTKEAPDQTQREIKRYSTAPVSMEYLDQNHYPVFRNDTMPTLNADEAHATALEALHAQSAAQASTTDKTKKPAKKTAKTKAAKPARKATASAQVRQAQALQNNPLQQNTTQNGTVPANFLNDGVLGPDGFGYNATDPAFAQ